ncbi:hypothetical protein [Pseudorhizobium pelagicum]|uniref:SnoaL-like domain-containing protein n=1 Tax=Pseudorhizobium pelagicum TaxID=1509405 RepID=A0A922P062_9HYPH|nr:hypothetical protein [Pseudorhizobium pelagicum]KEQ02773.1 hypothetical protein GV67_16995 [Pseudorhizobium pelagicum]KEQ02815.1 hypothetical protein GV68_19960 [Pseudorhizobium pelagicum]
MKYSKFIFAALTVGSFATPTFAQEQALCPQEGPDAPLALHEEWIMEGWERHEGDPTFVFSEEMAKFYDLENPQGVFWDNFAPGNTQLFTNASTYGANWEAHVNASRSIRHGMTDAHHAVVGSGTASSVIGFVGRIEPLDGEVVAFDTRSQLGWACVGGTWKIKHELNYAWIVEEDSIEPILGKRLQP